MVLSKKKGVFLAFLLSGISLFFPHKPLFPLDLDECGKVVKIWDLHKGPFKFLGTSENIRLIKKEFEFFLNDGSGIVPCRISAEIATVSSGALLKIEGVPESRQEAIYLRVTQCEAIPPGEEPFPLLPISQLESGIASEPGPVVQIVGLYSLGKQTDPTSINHFSVQDGTGSVLVKGAFPEGFNFSESKKGYPIKLIGRMEWDQKFMASKIIFTPPTGQGEFRFRALNEIYEMRKEAFLKVK